MAALSIAESTFPYRPLGRRIAELREAQRWSQRELAEYANVNPGYLPRIETGRNRPSPEYLRDIARALGADYAELAALAGYADAPAESDPDMPGWLRQHVELLKQLPREAADVIVSNARNVAELTGRLTRVDVREEMRREHEAQQHADDEARKQNHQRDQDDPGSASAIGCA